MPKNERLNGLGRVKEKEAMDIIIKVIESNLIKGPLDYIDLSFVGKAKITRSDYNSI